MELSPLFERHADDTESCADAAGGQCSGVALRHDLALAGHEFRAKAADGFVGSFFLKMDLLGFFDHGLLDLGEVGSKRSEFGEAALHALKSPEKIYGGRASFCERVADFREFSTESFDGRRGRM